MMTNKKPMTPTRRIFMAIAALAMAFGMSVAPASAKDDKAHSKEVLQGASNFIQNLGDRAIDILENEDLSSEEINDRFRDLLNDSFDMSTIGRFVLGRYWRQASDEQQEEYQDLFRKMVEEVYLSRFEDYSGQKFDVMGPRADGAGRDIIINSKLIPPEGDASEVLIDWRVRYKNSRYQIVDVIVEGVSMSMTKRQDFSAVIQRGGGKIDALLTELEKKYANGNSKG